MAVSGRGGRKEGVANVRMMYITVALMNDACCRST